MAYSNVQASNYRKKIRSPYSLLLDDEARRGLGTAAVKSRMSRELSERQRSEDVNMWNKDFALQAEKNKLATKGARFSAGAEAAKLGYNVWDKSGATFGGGGTNWVSRDWGKGSSWGGAAGSALGGAAMGYGLASMFGSGSKKNQKAGAIAGGLGGLLLNSGFLF